MKPAAVRTRARPSPGGAAPSAPLRWPSLVVVPALLALANVVAFLPALDGGFVNWDDDQNFLDNPNYRGLGAAQLRWMFTTFLMGHYIPVTGMTLGLDYLLWGMVAAGYHLTNLLLHTANAVLFYFVTLRLLQAGTPSRRADPFGLTLGAAFAALLFGVHPLRAESVAWITERRDVLSGLFYLSALVAYLRYCEAAPQGDGRARRLYAACLGFFALALLSKVMSVSLPVVLLILDAHPLRRLRSVGGPPGLRGEAWSVVMEKVPFLLLGLVVGVIGFAAAAHGAKFHSIADLDLVDRMAVSVYGLAFYLWKTAVPVALSPLYALPQRLDPGAGPFLLGGVVVLGLTAAAIALRRRWPALAAVWAGHVVILSPVVGLLQIGPQIAADRYTYLASGGWALLGGAGLTFGWTAWQRRKIDTRCAALLAALAVAVVAGLGILTWNQVKIWHDSERLWAHAVAVWPSSLGHFKLGVTLAHRGDLTGAIEHFHSALRIDPRDASAHSGLGFAFAVQGKVRDAIEQFDRALRLDPRQADAHTGLGLVLGRQGKLAEAAEHFRQALESNPRDAQAHTNLGLILKGQGKRAEAAGHFEQAVRIDPGSAQARRQWALALAEQGRLTEAAAHLQEAVRIDPRYADAHESLGEVLLRQGKMTESEAHIREARRLRP